MAALESPRLDRLVPWLNQWRKGDRGNVFRWFAGSFVILASYLFIVGGVAVDHYCLTRSQELEGPAARQVRNECNSTAELIVAPIAVVLLLAVIHFLFHVLTAPIAALDRRRRARRLLGPNVRPPDPRDTRLDETMRLRAMAFADQTRPGHYRYAARYLQIVFVSTILLAVYAAIMTFMAGNYILDETRAGSLHPIELVVAYLHPASIALWWPTRRLLRKVRATATRLTTEEDTALRAPSAPVTSPQFHRPGFGLVRD